jgi:hypothetical protein
VRVSLWRSLNQQWRRRGGVGYDYSKIRRHALRLCRHNLLCTAQLFANANFTLVPSAKRVTSVGAKRPRLQISKLCVTTRGNSRAQSRKRGVRGPGKSLEEKILHRSHCSSAAVALHRRSPDSLITLPERRNTHLTVENMQLPHKLVWCSVASDHSEVKVRSVWWGRRRNNRAGYAGDT